MRTHTYTCIHAYMFHCCSKCSTFLKCKVFSHTSSFHMGAFEGANTEKAPSSAPTHGRASPLNYVNETCKSRAQKTWAGGNGG